MDSLACCILQADLLTEGLLIHARLLCPLMVDFSPCFLILEGMQEGTSHPTLSWSFLGQTTSSLFGITREPLV